MPSKMRPNILLFLPDQHRFDFVGTIADFPVRTPNFDRLCQQGVQFTQALCPSPLCAPSRASLAAGKDYHRCRVANNQEDYPLDQETFYQMLRDSGYYVGGVGKFDLQKASAEHSLDGKALIHTWGFTDGIDNKGKWDAVNTWDGTPHDPYMAFLDAHKLAEVHISDMESRRSTHYAKTEPTPLPDNAYCDNWIADNGLQLIEASPHNQPWFLQVNFTGPHSPMDITTPMHDRWQDVPFNPPNDNNQFEHQVHTKIRQNYAAMVENIDTHLGRYLDAIDARGELDNTLIIYSSDHGEMLGDHNCWGKSTYYHPSVSVPLVIAGPGVKHGHMYSKPVLLHDLAATCLEYAGLPIPQNMDSLSLKLLLAGKTEQHRPYVLSGLVTPQRAWHLIFDGRYKYIQITGETPLLFDLERDPLENNNIAASAPQDVERMQKILYDELLRAAA